MLRTLLKASIPLVTMIALLGACSSPDPTLSVPGAGESAAPGVQRDSLAAAPPAPDTASVPAWGGYIGSGGE